ncbi:MAG: DUF2283 domain-containing protein [Archaeoglobaceae archaeon]
MNAEHKKADILRLKFSDERSVDSEMVDDDVVAYYNENGQLVGFEVWRARELVLPQFLQLIKEVKGI